MQKSTIKKVFMSIMGQIILGAGVSVILFANLGLDAFGVFHSGVSNIFNISVGMAIFFESLTAIIIIYFIDKSYVNFSTVASLFVVGFTVDNFSLILQLVFSDELSFIFQLLMVFLGSAIIGVGLNMYILADLGVGALDAIAEIISDKTGFEYQVVKIGNDLFFLAVGWALGGHVGVATVVTAFIIGPLIQIIRKKLSKPINSWISEH